MQKPRLSFWQIFNMSFGFLGIQFGWGLQLANMSGIYTYLGARPEDVPILWLSGPVTGLLVQPIIGSMSDRTSDRLWLPPPLFPHRSNSRQHCSVLHARFRLLMDGRRIALDFGCQH